MPLPQPLTGPQGPQGMADIEEHFKTVRFLPALLWLLRLRGTDMQVERSVASSAPLAAGAPHGEALAQAARNVYGAGASLGSTRPVASGATPVSSKAPVPSGTQPQFTVRVLLIDDDFTPSDALFASDFTEQRIVTLDELHVNDTLRYVRADHKRRAYQVLSAPMILGGTTEMLRQYVITTAPE